MRAHSEASPVAAAIILGLALAGFFDGIVFHQILQWHHLLSSVEDPALRSDLGLNVTADGMFHAATWLLAVLGLIQLWRARRRFGEVSSGRSFLGWLLFGAGLFNGAEGLIVHLLLGLHHLREASPNPLAWDLGYVASGILLMGLGAALARSPAARPPRSIEP